MTHWSILTFVMTFAFCHNVQGQVNYTYNDTGCCTSRTKAQNLAKGQTALYRHFCLEARHILPERSRT